MFDTICALATALSDAGIGIIRISGEQAIDIASRFVKSKTGKQIDFRLSHLMRYAFVYDGENPVDEVMVVCFIAPRSYTGENTVEIQCHGGVFLLKKILSIAIQNGARLAEPGEFTKRAFLNGRIDLTQAEAVSDLIYSTNEQALKASISQLRGSLFNIIESYRKELLQSTAYLEAALDDPENYSLDGFSDTLFSNVNNILNGLSDLVKSSDNGRIIKEGIKTAIVGKPNAGKSSLLNALLGENRAIVTNIAGTTRDTLEEYVKCNDLCLHLIDTAGIRNTDNSVEILGVERAIQAVSQADLVIYVVDASVPLDDSDDKIIKMLVDKRTIILLNKSDLPILITKEEIQKHINSYVIDASVKEMTGIEDLKNLIQEIFMKKEIDYNHEIVITNLRHKNLLLNAIDSLKSVITSIESKVPEDLYTIDLMNAYRELGLIIGEEISDDLINEIFRKFCMGK